MRDPKPPPVAYATPGVDRPLSADLPSATWRTAAAAAWLAGVLVAVYVAGGLLADQQQAIGQAVFGLAAHVPVYGPDGLVALAMGCHVAVETPIVVGGLSAVTLYHWRRPRLAWVTVLPATVGTWALLSGSATRPYLYGGAFWSVAVTAVQCGLTYAGTQIGRPVGRWLARHLLPPAMAVELVSLWM